MVSNIVEKETGNIIGTSVTHNHRLSFNDVCKLAGLEWKSYPEVETDGWYDGDILWDESVAEMVTE